MPLKKWSIHDPQSGQASGRSKDTSPWRRRFDTIHATLRERITLLTYPPSTRLDIDRLAHEFGVSRTPIRNVLQRLERDGLVLTRHGVGTMVTEIDLTQVREATLLRMHLAEMIGAIHPLPPSQAAMELIESLPDQIRHLQMNKDYQDHVRIDMRLHQCTSTLIGSDLFLQTYDELFFRAVRMYHTILPLLDWDTEIDTLKEHIILTRNAMRRGDIKAVGLITRNAISTGLFRLDEQLTDNYSPDHSACP